MCVCACLGWGGGVLALEDAEGPIGHAEESEFSLCVVFEGLT